MIDSNDASNNAIGKNIWIRQ